MSILRPARLLALACVLPVALCGCTKESSATAYATPEAAFDGVKKAFEKEDWPALCQCLTEDSVDVMAAGLVMAGSMMEAFAAMGGEDGAAAAKQVKEVLKKHGVESDALKKMGEQNADMEPAEAMKKVVEPIQDRPAFIGDMFAAMKAMKGDQAAAPPQLQPAAKLVDMKIEGDAATGSIEVEGEKKPIAFKKVNGGWLVDIAAVSPM